MLVTIVVAEHEFKTELGANYGFPDVLTIFDIQQEYLAGSCSLLLLAQHKGLPGAEAVLRGVVVPQGSCLPQLQSQTTNINSKDAEQCSCKGCTSVHQQEHVCVGNMCRLHKFAPDAVKQALHVGFKDWFLRFKVAHRPTLCIQECHWKCLGKAAYLLLVGNTLLPCPDGSLAQGEVEVLKGTGGLEAHVPTMEGGTLPCLKGIHQLPAGLPPAQHVKASQDCCHLTLCGFHCIHLSTAC